MKQNSNRRSNQRQLPSATATSCARNNNVPRSQVEPTSTTVRNGNALRRSSNQSQSQSARTTPHSQVEPKSASGPHVRQGDVKRKGADLLVTPLKLSVRLPCMRAAQHQQVLRSAERRNPNACRPRSVGRFRRSAEPNYSCTLSASASGTFLMERVCRSATTR